MGMEGSGVTAISALKKNKVTKMVIKKIPLMGMEGYLTRLGFESDLTYLIK